MFRFSIDRGGTFTDVYAECPGGEVKVMKLLSEDPNNYSDAPREAIRRIMEEVGSSIIVEQCSWCKDRNSRKKLLLFNVQLSVTSEYDPLPV